MIRKFLDWYWAFAAQVESTSVWKTYGRRKRLAWVGALTLEFGLLTAGMYWFVSYADADRRFLQLTCLGVSVLWLFMFSQFAFWPRGAIIRCFRFLPWYMLGSVVAIAVETSLYPG